MTEKVGRNEPCPCGSGKKYKRCHGSLTIPANQPDTIYFSRIRGGLVNNQGMMLGKHWHEEIPKIAPRFENLYAKDLVSMEAEISQILFLITRSAEQGLEEARRQGMRLIASAMKSVLAAIDLVRIGYSVQAVNVLRHAVESLSFAFYVCHVDGAVETFSRAKLTRGEVERYVKQLMPGIGRLHGILSTWMSHVHPSQLSAPWYITHEKPEIEVIGSMRLVRRVIDMIAIIQEYVILPYMEKPRFWVRLENGNCYYGSTKEALEARRRFVRGEHALPSDGKESK